MNLLRDFETGDIENYYTELKNCNRKFLIQLSGTGYNYPITKEQILSDLNNENFKLFKFINEDNIIGYCHLTRINWEQKKASIGRVFIIEKYRNQGYSYKMLTQLIKHAKSVLNINEITLRVFEYNQPALNCYKKLGFVEIQREDILYKDINESICCITMKLKYLSDIQ